MRHAARQHGVPVTGTIGILVLAVRQGHLSSAEANGLLSTLIELGYHSPVVNLDDLISPLEEQSMSDHPIPLGELNDETYAASGPVYQPQLIAEERGWYKVDEETKEAYREPRQRITLSTLAMAPVRKGRSRRSAELP